MTPADQLEFCKICKKRTLDPARGIVCSLTFKKPAFDLSCPDFEKEISRQQRMAGREMMNDRMRGKDNRPSESFSWKTLALIISICYSLYGLVSNVMTTTSRDEIRSKQNTISTELANESKRERIITTGFVKRQFNGIAIPDTTFQINDVITLKFPNGFHLIPSKNGSDDLSLFANRYFVEFKRMPVNNQITAYSQWLVMEDSRQKLSPVINYATLQIHSMGRRTITTNNLLVHSADFTYDGAFGTRYGVLEIIEHEGELLIFTISGSEEKYEALRKYLKYYLKY